VRRGTVFGPIRSLQALVSTSYGIVFLASLVIMVLLAAYGGVTRRHLASRVGRERIYTHRQPTTCAGVAPSI